MTPFQRAERIIADMGLNMPTSDETRLLNAITEAIQAESNAQLARQRAGHYGDVREFVDKFGQHRPGKPGFPDQATLDLRVRLLAEEFMEFISACGFDCDVRIGREEESGNVISYKEIWYRRLACCRSDFARAVDGLLDMEYIIHGTHLAFGVDPAEPWARVHAANMSKEGGATRADGKIMKPEGFQPPDIEGALKAQGWQG